MGEKIYNTMKSVGSWNLVWGIVLIVVSVGLGVAMIVNGAKLLNKKKDIMF